MTSAWRNQAACLAAGDLMFPEPSDRRGVIEAKRVCAACPVIEACLADAMADEGGRGKASRFGVRGGLDTGQRHAMYRRLVPAPKTVRPNNSGKPLAPCGTKAAYDRHVRRKEPIDGACRQAHADRRREERASTREAAACGTRSGYQRHRKNGEDACTACRQANTDADNRLRRTGTTKAAA